MTSVQPVPKDSPAFGERLLHQTLDHISRTTPDRLYAAIPQSADLSDGFRDITFSDVARCSNFVANWIQDNVGRSQNFETLCYIGIPDLRSVAVFFGAVKCGYKVSFRNIFVISEANKKYRFSFLPHAIQQLQMHRCLSKLAAQRSSM